MKRLDAGWFNQAWYAEHRSTLSTDGTAYGLRNVRSGSMCLSQASLFCFAMYLRGETLAYLQVGKKLPDGSAELEMTAKVTGPRVKGQTWYITNDGGFAR